MSVNSFVKIAGVTAFEALKYKKKKKFSAQNIPQEKSKLLIVIIIRQITKCSTLEYINMVIRLKYCYVIVIHLFSTLKCEKSR